jgi:hypothetical protein
VRASVALAIIGEPSHRFMTSPALADSMPHHFASPARIAVRAQRRAASSPR